MAVSKLGANPACGEGASLRAERVGVAASRAPSASGDTEEEEEEEEEEVEEVVEEEPPPKPSLHACL